MGDIEGRIEKLEAQAAESELIANLSTQWQVRSYNSRLAKDLHAAAENLRRRGRVEEMNMD